MAMIEVRQSPSGPKVLTLEAGFIFRRSFAGLVGAAEENTLPDDESALPLGDGGYEIVSIENPKSDRNYAVEVSALVSTVGTDGGTSLTPHVECVIEVNNGGSWSEVARISAPLSTVTGTSPDFVDHFGPSQITFKTDLLLGSNVVTDEGSPLQVRAGLVAWQTSEGNREGSPNNVWLTDRDNTSGGRSSSLTLIEELA